MIISQTAYKISLTYHPVPQLAVGLVNLDHSKYTHIAKAIGETNTIFFHNNVPIAAIGETNAILFHNDAPIANHIQER